MQYKRPPAATRHLNEFGEPRFVHETVFNSYAPDAPELVMSLCMKCHRFVAASANADLLAAVEAEHQCFVPMARTGPKAA